MAFQSAMNLAERVNRWAELSNYALMVMMLIIAILSLIWLVQGAH
jgi:hypothetical protein